MSTSSSYKDQLSRAAQELRSLLAQVKVGRQLDRLTVSPSTDAIVGFRKLYQARLTSRVTMDDADFQEHLLQDVQNWLHTVTALIDYMTATGITTKEQVDEQAAVGRYNARRKALDRFLDYLFTARVPYAEGEVITDKTPRIVAQLRGKSEREIFQAVARVVPIEPGLDGEITSLLYGLTRGAHDEPAVQKLVTQGSDLTEPLHESTLRSFASSQALRDYVGPYLAALIKKALSEDGVEAYDDAFRNTYFAVVNRVQNYYQSLPVTRDKAPSTTETLDARRETVGAVAAAKTGETNETEDERRKTLGMNEMGDDRWEALGAPDPFVTEDQAEIATHEKPAPTAQPKTVRGTGLE